MPGQEIEGVGEAELATMQTEIIAAAAAEQGDDDASGAGQGANAGGTAAAPAGAGSDGAAAGGDRGGTEGTAPAAVPTGEPKPPPGKENWIPQGRLNAVARARQAAEAKADTAEKRVRELEAQLEAARRAPPPPSARAQAATAADAGAFDVDAWAAGQDQPGATSDQADAAAAAAQAATAKADAARKDPAVPAAVLKRIEAAEKIAAEHAAELAAYRTEREDQTFLAYAEDARKSYCPVVPSIAFAKAQDIYNANCEAAGQKSKDLDLYVLAEKFGREIQKAQAAYPDVPVELLGDLLSQDPRTNLMAAAEDYRQRMTRWGYRYVGGQAQPGAAGGNGGTQHRAVAPAAPMPVGAGAPPPRKMEDAGPANWDDATVLAQKEWSRKLAAGEIDID